MTYYEELGVPIDAPAEEIHRAYRQLTRLLHPDPHADAELRQAAERQMRRVNEIHALLSDPERRAAYDASLGEHTARARDPVPWIAAAAAVAAIVWVVGVNRPPDAGLPPVAPPALQNPLVGPNPAPRPRRPVPSAAGPRTGVAQDEIRRPREENDLVASRPQAFGSDPAAPHLAAAPTAAPLPAHAPAPATSISGTWFYAAGGSKDARLPYPPEYIEAVIVERAGSIRGRYRARYRVHDRAISPMVAFAFEGASDGALPWRGPAGARGEVHVRLVDRSLLEVSWSADDLGSEMGLAAGRAVLTRAR